jgi:carboxymethylenebutenolidase
MALYDAAFFHPEKGAHPGVLIRHDSLGLRPAMRKLGRRIAAGGYAVLVPNLFYRNGPKDLSRNNRSLWSRLGNSPCRY